MEIRANVVGKPSLTIIPLFKSGAIMFFWGAKTDIRNVLWVRIIKLSIGRPHIMRCRCFMTVEDLMEILTRDSDKDAK